MLCIGEQMQLGQAARITLCEHLYVYFYINEEGFFSASCIHTAPPCSQVHGTVPLRLVLLLQLQQGDRWGQKQK